MLTVLILPLLALVAAFVARRPYYAALGYLFTLGVLPRGRLLFGSSNVPLYFVDIFIGLALVRMAIVLLSGQPVRWRRTSVDTLVLLFLLFSVPGLLRIYIQWPDAALPTRTAGEPQWSAGGALAFSWKPAMISRRECAHFQRSTCRPGRVPRSRVIMWVFCGD